MIRAITPQPHGSRWTKEEVDFLEESIHRDCTLEEVKKTISLRTKGAILTKANSLGYGNYRNKNNGFIYFKSDITHRIRKKGSKMYISTDLKKPADTSIKLTTCIIPKDEPNMADIDKLIALAQEHISSLQLIIGKFETLKNTAWIH